MSDLSKFWRDDLSDSTKEKIKQYSIQAVLAIVAKLAKVLLKGAKKLLDKTETVKEVSTIEVPVKDPKKITWIASPNFSSRKGKDITAIVLHHTGPGGLKATLSWFKKKESQVSAHYVVDRDGDVYQMVKEDKKAWHAGKSSLQGESNVNAFSVGIEMVSNGKRDGYTKKQYESVVFLCKMLKKKYDIVNDRIVGHAHVAPGRKIDPEAFDWNRLFDAINKK